MSFIKKHFRLLFLVFLFLLGTLLVVSSVGAIFILPLLLLTFMYLHSAFKDNDTITFLWRTLRSSTTVYFVSLFFFLIFTPEWMKTLSQYLERYSFFTLFEKSSFMYGRVFISFLLFNLTFLAYAFEYRAQKKRALDNAEK